MVHRYLVRHFPALSRLFKVHALGHIADLIDDLGAMPATDTEVRSCACLPGAPPAEVRPPYPSRRAQASERHNGHIRQDIQHTNRHDNSRDVATKENAMDMLRFFVLGWRARLAPARAWPPPLLAHCGAQ